MSWLSKKVNKIGDKLIGKKATSILNSFSDPFDIFGGQKDRNNSIAQIPNDVQITDVASSGATEGVIDSLAGDSTINRNKKVWNKILGARSLQIPLAAEYAQFKDKEE